MKQGPAPPVEHQQTTGDNEDDEAEVDDDHDVGEDQVEHGPCAVGLASPCVWRFDDRVGRSVPRQKRGEPGDSRNGLSEALR